MPDPHTFGHLTPAQQTSAPPVIVDNVFIAGLRVFVRESNRIEGITRPPLKAEMKAHFDLLDHSAPDIGAMQRFVWAVAGKPLREHFGMNVRVGPYIAPPGGPDIAIRLGLILRGAHRGDDPWAVHNDYETLHPFMDGNGRSGRALWLWQMLRQRSDPYVLQRGFLHTFYYQTLGAYRPPERCERSQGDG